MIEINPQAIHLKAWKSFAIYLATLVLMAIFFYFTTVAGADSVGQRNLMIGFTVTGLLAMVLPLMNLAVMSYFLSKLFGKNGLLIAMVAFGFTYLFIIQPIRGAYLTDNMVDNFLFGILVTLPSVILVVLWFLKTEFFLNPKKVCLCLAGTLGFMFLYIYIYTPFRVGLSFSDWYQQVLIAHLMLSMYITVPITLAQLLPLWIATISPGLSKK